MGHSFYFVEMWGSVWVECVPVHRCGRACTVCVRVRVSGVAYPSVVRVHIMPGGRMCLYVYV